MDLNQCISNILDEWYLYNIDNLFMPIMNKWAVNEKSYIFPKRA